MVWVVVVASVDLECHLKVSPSVKPLVQLERFSRLHLQLLLVPLVNNWCCSYPVVLTASINARLGHLPEMF